MTATANDFPITWADPADRDVTWHFELEHTPDVCTPLGFDLYFSPMLHGFGWARVMLQNSYVYVWYREEAFDEASTGLGIDKLRAAGESFWTSIVPEVEGYTQRFLTTDFDAFSDDELTQELAELPASRFRMGWLHTLALFPHGAGMDCVIKTYKELVDDDELAALRLMQGFGNKSVEVGNALWELAQQATSIPSVRGRIENIGEGGGIECLAALRAEPGAHEFVAAFDSFLADYGWRADLFELSQPTWAEDPSIPLGQMRVYMEKADDPRIEQERLANEREEARREVLSRLTREDARKLQDVLDMARHVVSLQEDHNFYIDQRCAYSARRPILAGARRLVSNGQLSESNDVFYLTGVELLAAMRGTLRDAQSVADKAKADMARWSEIEPPAWIGSPPAASEAPPPANEAEPIHLAGNGASAGVARGTARVLMSLSEAARFQRGDVLIARTTMPAWTPLFEPACAIITETGGMLSHAAVVAREYGIPAVLAVKDATRKIRDGQVVEVDGSKGTVRIIS